MLESNRAVFKTGVGSVSADECLALLRQATAIVKVGFRDYDGVPIWMPESYDDRSKKSSGWASTYATTHPPSAQCQG
jgi:hypothetical protein